MAYRFAKGLVAGCALSTAIAAVGYTQINSFLPLTPQAPTAVSAEHQVPAVNSVEVSAFIANTQLMAQPAVASGRDIARAQVLTVALTEDFLPAETAQNDELINRTPTIDPTVENNSDVLGPLVPYMVPRPAGQSGFVEVAANEQVTAPTQRRVVRRSEQNNNPVFIKKNGQRVQIKQQLRWSVGEFR
jgi:hypothetical protein